MPEETQCEHKGWYDGCLAFWPKYDRYRDMRTTVITCGICNHCIANDLKPKNVTKEQPRNKTNDRL